MPDDVRVFAPATRHELRFILRDLAKDQTRLIVVAAGDGTLRDILTAGVDAWPQGQWPEIAILPKGKTNALAMDLGVPDDWEAADAIAAWRNGSRATRTPIEIVDPQSGMPVHGFLFGAGLFVDATDLAQTTHKYGAFDDLAVALSVVWVALKTVLSRGSSGLRAGKRMAVRFSGDAVPMHDADLDSERHRFIMMVSTMERMPLGSRPFGPVRKGLKALIVDAPPRRFLRNLIATARGSTAQRLERDGVHRVDATCIEIDLDGGFILDGERFPAGCYTLRPAAPLSFVTP